MSYDILNNVFLTTLTANGCCDSSGQTAFVSGRYGFNILRSTNFGKSWSGSYFSSNPINNVCCNSIGTKLAASTENGNIWLSTNSGTSWTEKQSFGGSKFFTGICCDSSGSKIAACVDSGNVWLSTDSGTTWAEKQSFGGGRSFRGICCDSTQTTIVASDTSGIWLSYNSGANWTLKQGFGGRTYFSRPCCNSTGTIIAAVDQSGAWISKDSGTTWSLSSTIFPGNNYDIQTDGNRFIVSARQIYVSYDGLTFTQIYTNSTNFYYSNMVINNNCSVFYSLANSILSNRSIRYTNSSSIKTFFDSGASNYTYKGTPLNKIIRFTPESDTASTLQLIGYKTANMPNGLQCDLSFGGSHPNSKISLPTNFFLTPTSTTDYPGFVSPKYYKYNVLDPQNHTFDPNCTGYFALGVGAGGGGSGGTYSVDPANPQSGSGGGGGGSGAMTWFYCSRPSAVTDISYTVGIGGDGSGNNDTTPGYRYGSSGTSGGSTIINYISAPSTVTAITVPGGTAAPSTHTGPGTGAFPVTGGAGGPVSTIPAPLAPAITSLAGTQGGTGKGSGPEPGWTAGPDAWAAVGSNPIANGNGVIWNNQPSAMIPGRGGSIQSSSPTYTFSKNNTIDLCSNLILFNNVIPGSGGYTNYPTTVVSEYVEYGRGGWGGLGESAYVTYGPVADFGGNTYNHGTPGVVIIVEYFN